MKSKLEAPVLLTRLLHALFGLILGRRSGGILVALQFRDANSDFHHSLHFISLPQTNAMA